MDHMPLNRLETVFGDRPIYFITTCTRDRRMVLNSDTMYSICNEVWANTEKLYGWLVGRYVIMPDHVHFFCASKSETSTLETFVGKWKEWTAKYAVRRHGIQAPLWQERFFDHVLRTGERYGEKCNYVFDNPVRAKLVANRADWKYQGERHEFRADDLA